MDDLASRIAAHENPIMIIIEVKGATNKLTIKSNDNNLGANNQPGREEGSKGVAIRSGIREMKEIGIQGLVR